MRQRVCTSGGNGVAKYNQMLGLRSATLLLLQVIFIPGSVFLALLWCLKCISERRIRLRHNVMYFIGLFLHHLNNVLILCSELFYKYGKNSLFFSDVCESEDGTEQQTQPTEKTKTKPEKRKITERTIKAKKKKSDEQVFCCDSIPLLHACSSLFHFIIHTVYIPSGT